MRACVRACVRACDWCVLSPSLSRDEFEQLIDVSGNGGYYAYGGSLTGPECSVPVTWVVMARISGISRTSIGAFRDVSARMDRAFYRSAPSFRPLQVRCREELSMKRL